MAGNRTFTVTVRINADGSTAVREVKKAETAYDRLRKSITGSVAGFAAATASVAALVSGVRASISAFLEQESAVRRLDASLLKLGPAAAETSRALQDQAAALQKVTEFGDEAVINAQALLSTFGVAPQQLGEATQATVDLAAALGISLESAARNVGRTVGGFAGELGEVIPELKTLSSEALQAGEGITLLAERFAGQAVENAKTFRGELAQLNNAFGDFQERIGQAIAQNDAASASIGGLTTAFEELASPVSKTIVFLGEGLVGALRNLSLPLRGLFQLVSSITGLFVDNSEAAAVAAEGYENMNAHAQRLGITLEELERRIAESKKQTAELAGTVTNEAREVEESTTTHRGLLSAFDDLIRASPEWQREIQKSESAHEENTRAVDDEVRALREFALAQSAAREAVQQTNTVLEQQTRRVDIFNAQGQRTGSRLTSSPTDPLFPGLSGASYTYTIRRSSPTENGGVRFH